MGDKKETVLKNIALHRLSWGTMHYAALRSIQDSWQQAVKMAFSKKGHTVSIYKDASKKYLAGVVTQTKTMR